MRQTSTFTHNRTFLVVQLLEMSFFIVYCVIIVFVTQWDHKISTIFACVNFMCLRRVSHRRIFNQLFSTSFPRFSKNRPQELQIICRDPRVFFLQIQFKNIENYYFPLNCDAHFAPHKIFPRYPHVPQIQTFDPTLTCISMILCPCSSVKVAPARLADTDLWLLLPASLATSGRLEPTGFLLASPSWAS